MVYIGDSWVFLVLHRFTINSTIFLIKILLGMKKISKVFRNKDECFLYRCLMRTRSFKAAPFQAQKGLVENY